MNDIVSIKGNDIFTDSMIIANGTGNKHKSVVTLIKKYEKDFNEFGSLRFSDLKSTNPQGGRPTKVYQLNEEQDTLLVTFLDNNEVVRKFKVELVKQFYAMRQFILEKQSKAWVETRQQGKLTRKSETDIIKIFVEYAQKQGSKHADMYYITFSKLANRMAEIESRENATVSQLNNLSLIENIILNQIRIGIGMGKEYKEIYQDCRRQIELFKDVAYLSVTA